MSFKSFYIQHDIYGSEKYMYICRCMICIFNHGRTNYGENWVIFIVHKRTQNNKLWTNTDWLTSYLVSMQVSSGK